jgi:hypothetical protein
MTYEIRIRDFTDSDEALALQNPISRLLCPEPEHEGPCDIPWGFTLSGNDLVLGIYTTQAEATTVADSVQQLTDHPVTLTEAAPTHFTELADQYRIEHQT